jgi:ABC-type tungstate transport system permease subunit
LYPDFPDERNTEHRTADFAHGSDASHTAGIDLAGGGGSWYRDIGTGMGAAGLASAEGQAAIGAYELNGEPLLHPSATDPK